MKKFFKWFFGILIALVIVGVILFCTGFMRVKFETQGGTEFSVGIAGFQKQGFINYITKDLECKFAGFRFNFNDNRKVQFDKHYEEDLIEDMVNMSYTWRNSDDDDLLDDDLND